MKTMTRPGEDQEMYREQLFENREMVMGGLGVRFDTMARMGRVAEDDQAQLTHEEFVSLHLNSLDYLKLRLIEEALDRLGSGDYGVCLACEETIPAKRLHAIPWARYCVTCQDSVGAQMDAEAMAGRRVHVEVGE